MKKAIIALLIIGILILGAVGGLFWFLNIEKEPITASEFKAIMEGKDFKLIDGLAQFAEYDYIKEVYLALNQDDNYQLEFYELSDVENAMSFFNVNKEIFESKKSGTSSETTLNGKNYSKYVLSSDGEYMLLSRIDNTVIYVYEDLDLKDTINDLLDELGY